MNRQFFLTAAVFALLIMPVPSYAQSQSQSKSRDDGTTASSRPSGKHVRNMTSEERRAYWNSLPEEDKNRIRARRAYNASPEARKRSWDKLSAEEKAALQDRSTVDQFQSGPGKAYARPWTSTQQEQYQSALKQRLENGRSQWEAMSPDEKRKFLRDYKADIDNAGRAMAAQKR